MSEKTTLYADNHVDRGHRTDPLEAAAILADIWCREHTDYVDVWGCNWPCPEFFEAFLDHCREKGFLKEALHIWWYVHNCPGPEIEPCHSNHVHQQMIDYSVKYGLESETDHLKEHGLDKFKLLEQINEPYKDQLLMFCCPRLSFDIYPNPKDENGRFIPLLKDKGGRFIHWPKNTDGSYMTCEELEKAEI